MIKKKEKFLYFYAFVNRIWWFVLNLSRRNKKGSSQIYINYDLVWILLAIKFVLLFTMLMTQTS